MHAVRGLLPLEQTPGVISLLAGKPNDAMFPFTSVQFTVPRPDSSEQMLLKVDDDLLSRGLQYAQTSGIPSMVEWLTEFQEQEHGRRRQEGWRISVTAGSQDAIYKVRLVITSHLSLTHRYSGHTSARGLGRSCPNREARLCVRKVAPR
jgi:tryptophan aminotransferase